MSNRERKDVEVTWKDAHLHFSYLEWDTDFFGIPSYRLYDYHIPSGEEKSVTTKITSVFSSSFVTAKFNNATTSLPLLVAFQDAGFRHMDTEITLRRHSASSIMTTENDQRISVELQKENCGLPYEELGGVYTLTRFHADPRIGKKKADALWVAYLRNYQPSPERLMFIARVDGEVAGTMMVNCESGSDVALLFFVAVQKKFQGRGVGSALLSFITHWADTHKQTLVTETQARNIGALNFYIAGGFRTIDKTSTVLHRWS